MIYGYCYGPYANTAKRQADSIRKVYPNAVIYKEYANSSKEDLSEQWYKLMQEIKSGDILVFDSIIALPATDGEYAARLYLELRRDSGLKLIFLKEPYINSDIYGKGILRDNGSVQDIAIQQIIIAYDQASKRQESSERGNETLINSKLKSGDPEAHTGRPKGTTRETHKSETAKEYIELHSRAFGGTLTDKQIKENLAQSGLDVSTASISKYKKAIKLKRKSNS